jgi:hypothetical protein
MKFSTQATAALLMTLQKCLIEETDIVDLLTQWDMTEEDGEIFVSNPPTFSPNKAEEPTSFEVPDNI